MKAKTTSCERCIRNNPNLVPKQEIYESIKKPESYLAKKFDQLYHEDRKLREKKIKKIQLYKHEREEKQLNNCTFQPKVNANQDYFISNSSFLKREVEWKSSIEKKIAAKRQLEENNNKKKYTFQPKISAYPNSTICFSKVEKVKQSTNNHQNKALNTKRSYKNIHIDRKKFKQINKTVCIEPFQHRRYQSSMQNLINNQSVTLSKTMTTIQQSFSQSPFKKEKNMLIVDQNEKDMIDGNPEEHHTEFPKELKIKKVEQYDLTDSKNSNFSDGTPSPIKHLPHSAKKTILKMNSMESMQSQQQVIQMQTVNEELHNVVREQSSQQKNYQEIQQNQEPEEEEIF